MSLGVRDLGFRASIDVGLPVTPITYSLVVITP